MFRKLAGSVFDSTPERRIYDVVIEHIRQQVERPPWHLDESLLEQMPAQVQTIYWAWRFDCDAGGGGIMYFLIEQQGIYARQVHEALSRLGAHELVTSLEAAIPFAISSHAEFLRLQDLSWFRQFSPRAEFPSDSAIDDRSWTHLRSLRRLLTQYILEHREVLAVCPRY
jgi:hypothetical protein